MWIPPIGGHYVAVLEVTSDCVIVGDPLSGRGKWDRHEFEQDWKGAAHEISRDPCLSTAPRHSWEAHARQEERFHQPEPAPRSRTHDPILTCPPHCL